VELAAARLAEVLLARRPAVVLTYEPAGGYGHPDHVHAHRVTMRAVELATARGLGAPCVLWAALDEEALRRGYLECHEGASLPGSFTAPDPLGPLPSAAVSPGEVDLVVEVAPVLDRVVAALACHRTQVQAVRLAGSPDVGEPVTAARSALGFFALSNGVLQPLLAQESYRRAAGDLATVRWPQGVLVR
jgi:N-acetyl-1-D-myo-inositol-2-amino-2-deoxy-alpha-D-glucopyranoside deacetylase